jgi:hypothetical protein
MQRAAAENRSTVPQCGLFFREIEKARSFWRRRLQIAHPRTG